MLKLVKSGTRPGPKRGQTFIDYDVMDGHERVGTITKWSGESWRKSDRIRTGFIGHYYYWTGCAFVPKAMGLRTVVEDRFCRTRRAALEFIREKLGESDG